MYDPFRPERLIVRDFALMSVSLIANSAITVPYNVIDFKFNYRRLALFQASRFKVRLCLFVYLGLV